MREVLTNYGFVIVEFLFELYVFYFLVAKKLSKAKRFVPKVVLSAAILLGIAFGVTFFYTVFGEKVCGRISVYVFLFGCSILQMRLCFDESFKTILFCGGIAYAAQNLAYKVFLLLWDLLTVLGLTASWGKLGDFYYRIVYYAIFAGTVTAIYYAFIKNVINKLVRREIDFQLLALSVVVLAITTILCSVEDVYFDKITVAYSGLSGELSFIFLVETGNIFSIICCITVLLLISRTVEKKELLLELEYMQHAIRQSEKQYEISKDTIDLINVKIHDIKYKLNSVLAEKEISEDTLNELKESVAIYDTRMETGNVLLNVLLTEKSLYCEQNGISFSCMADGSKLSFMKEGDLYCLFCNVIDNALEAVKKITDKERRVINIVIKKKNDMLIIQEENYFDGKLKFEDGLPVTIKEDKNYHGFGMKSIRMIVHKYEGELTAYAENGVFHLNMIFGIAGEKTDN